MKRTLLLLSIISLFASSAVVTASAAVKSGSTCSKVNLTSTFGGYKYTCIKSGKKLVWSKGVKVVGKTIPTPSATPAPKVTSKQSPVIASADECKLKDQRLIKRQKNNVGFPIQPDLLPNKGVLNIAFIPIDFSDAPGTVEHLNEVNKQAVKLQNWYRDFSQGKLKIETTISNKWFRAPRATTGYTSGKGENYQANNFAAEWDKFAQELINSTGNSIDYSKIQAVFFYFPEAKQWNIVEGILGRGVDLMTPQGKKNLFYWADGTWHNDLYKSTKVPYSDMYSLWAHELLHSQGISLHAPANGWAIGTGQAMIRSTVLDTWETFLLGWLDDSQVYCAPLKIGQEVTVLLEPIENPSNGLRSAIVPLNSKKALVIESRRATGYSADWDPEDNGSFVYLVDVTKDNDRSGEGAGDWGNEESWDKWAYLLLPEGQKPFKTDQDNPDPKKNPQKRYLLKPGSKVIFDGVEITVLESGVVDAIAIKRTADSKDIPVGSATGVIRPYEPKKVTALDKLDGNLEGIAYWPWKLGTDKVITLNRSYYRDLVLTSKIGPNTKGIQADSKTGFDSASRLLERFKQATELFPIYFTFEDSRWAQEQFTSLSSQSKGNEAQSICPTKELCTGTHVEISSNGRAFMLIALPSTSNQVSAEDLTLAQARAYAIAVQQFQFKETTHEAKASCCIADFVPSWFIQGIAEFNSAIAISLGSDEKYLNFRKKLISDLKSSKLTVKDIESFLTANDPTVWKSKNPQLNSAIGFFVIESIISAKGLNSPMQILAYLALDNREATIERFLFRDAIEVRVKTSAEDLVGTPFLGVTWDQGISNLAKHIYTVVNS